MLCVKVLYKGQSYTAYLKLSGNILYKTKPIISFQLSTQSAFQLSVVNLRQLNKIINT